MRGHLDSNHCFGNIATGLASVCNKLTAHTITMNGIAEGLTDNTETTGVICSYCT